MNNSAIDVVGIGNAIVDVLAHVDDAFIETHGLSKGTMTLIDEATADRLYAAMGPAIEASGGSAANTIAALASLGGAGGFVGKVRDDQLGTIFGHDIQALGITFATPPATSGPSTARCLVLVTPDAQRTMQTYLGAAAELSPIDIDRELIASARITYLEGYLWDRPLAKEAFRKAAVTAHEAGRLVALSLSDPSASTGTAPTSSTSSSTTSTSCSPTRTKSSPSTRCTPSTTPCSTSAAIAGWRR